MIRGLYALFLIMSFATIGAAKSCAEDWSEPRCYNWDRIFSFGELWLQRRNEKGKVYVYGMANQYLNGPRTVYWEFSGVDSGPVYDLTVTSQSDDGTTVRNMTFIKVTPTELVISRQSYHLVNCDELLMKVKQKLLD